MAITPEMVEHVALLSRLAVSEEEKARAAKELSKIFGYVEQLAEVDVTGVEPCAHPLPQKNKFRPDEVMPGLPNDAALANAPEKEDVYFKVPQIV